MFANYHPAASFEFRGGKFKEPFSLEQTTSDFNLPFVLQVWEDRGSHDVSGQDLPRLTTGGWFVSGSWLLTNDKAAGVPPPRTPLFRGGIGALELAPRYERLWPGSEAPDQPDEDSPLAPNLVESTYGAWTFGVN